MELEQIPVLHNISCWRI